VLSRPVDLFLATTGIGMRAWFEAAESWGLLDDLLAALAPAEILARGPKSVGALRKRGLRELWAPESECFDDVLLHLRGRDLTGKRIVVQEHGQSLSMVAHALRRLGADVLTVTVYRVAPADDPEPMFRLIDLIADRALDAVTFTSAPAVAAMMEAAAPSGRRDEVVAAFQADVLAACVGPVTAAAFDLWGVPTVFPDRSRLVAMVRQLETELPARVAGVTLEVAGHQLVVHGDRVLLDGAEVRLSPAPYAVLSALLESPGAVVSRRELLAALPSGTARSEHAVEMAVARVRAGLGTRAIQTVVKRGYRLAVTT
jgi:uroporphyrinogen-III synthase